MTGVGTGFTCPDCGATDRAEIEGIISEVGVGHYTKAILLWCVHCEARWTEEVSHVLRPENNGH